MPHGDDWRRVTGRDRKHAKGASENLGIYTGKAVRRSRILTEDGLRTMLIQMHPMARVARVCLAAVPRLARTKVIGLIRARQSFWGNMSHLPTRLIGLKSLPVM